MIASARSFIVKDDKYTEHEADALAVALAAITSLTVATPATRRRKAA